MNELLDAAKSVIDDWDSGDRWCAIAHLRAAVDRAEKQEAVGFDWWWQRQGPKYCWDSYAETARAAWTAAQQAERERIKAIIKAVGVQGNSDSWFAACDTILEKLDDL